MICMKCGRDVEEGQVFCPSCLDTMKRYPVKPGIAVQLPHRTDSPAPKKPSVKRRQTPNQEDQIHRLKKRIRTLAFLWLVTLLLLAATIYPTVEFFLGKPFYLPGQNYSTIIDTPTGSSRNPVP